MPATGYSLFFTTTDTTVLRKFCPLYWGDVTDPVTTTPDLITAQKLCLYRSDYENQQMQ
jgi:hypothetical protein